MIKQAMMPETLRIAEQDKTLLQLMARTVNQDSFREIRYSSSDIRDITRDDN